MNQPAPTARDAGQRPTPDWGASPAWQALIRAEDAAAKDGVGNLVLPIGNARRKFESEYAQLFADKAALVAALLQIAQACEVITKLPTCGQIQTMRDIAKIARTAVAAAGAA